MERANSAAEAAKQQRGARRLLRGQGQAGVVAEAAAAPEVVVLSDRTPMAARSAAGAEDVAEDNVTALSAAGAADDEDGAVDKDCCMICLKTTKQGVEALTLLAGEGLCKCTTSYVLHSQCWQQWEDSACKCLKCREILATKQITSANSPVAWTTVLTVPPEPGQLSQATAQLQGIRQWNERLQDTRCGKCRQRLDRDQEEVLIICTSDLCTSAIHAGCIVPAPTDSVDDYDWWCESHWGDRQRSYSATGGVVVREE